MRTHFTPRVLALGLAAVLPAAAQDQAPAEAPAPEVAEAAPVDPEKVKADSSYGLGYRTGGEFGQRYGNFGITLGDLDSEAFMKGFLAGFGGDDPAVSEDRVAAAMEAFGNLLQAREQEMAEQNLAEGKAFLESNAGKDGVVTLPSGLQYKVLEKGGDEKYTAPKEGDPEKQFLVNYKGSLIDGTEFDSSGGEPLPMTLEVIEGFKEALTLMPVGAKWEVYIPSELGYGAQRRSAEIGPNAVLVFELQLVEIRDAPAHPGGLPFPLPEGE